jgi:hypothetical protein
MVSARGGFGRDENSAKLQSELPCESAFRIFVSKLEDNIKVGREDMLLNCQPIS